MDKFLPPFRINYCNIVCDEQNLYGIHEPSTNDEIYMFVVVISR